MSKACAPQHPTSKVTESPTLASPTGTSPLPSTFMPMTSTSGSARTTPIDWASLTSVVPFFGPSLNSISK